MSGGGGGGSSLRCVLLVGSLAECLLNEAFRRLLASVLLARLALGGLGSAPGLGSRRLARSSRGCAVRRWLSRLGARIVLVGSGPRLGRRGRRGGRRRPAGRWRARRSCLGRGGRGPGAGLGDLGRGASAGGLGRGARRLWGARQLCTRLAARLRWARRRLGTSLGGRRLGAWLGARLHAGFLGRGARAHGGGLGLVLGRGTGSRSGRCGAGLGQGARARSALGARLLGRGAGRRLCLLDRVRQGGHHNHAAARVDERNPVKRLVVQQLVPRVLAAGAHAAGDEGQVLGDRLDEQLELRIDRLERRPGAGIAAGAHRTGERLGVVTVLLVQPAGLGPGARGHRRVGLPGTQVRLGVAGRVARQPRDLQRRAAVQVHPEQELGVELLQHGDERLDRLDELRGEGRVLRKEHLGLRVGQRHPVQQLMEVGVLLQVGRRRRRRRHVARLGELLLAPPGRHGRRAAGQRRLGRGVRRGRRRRVRRPLGAGRLALAEPLVALARHALGEPRVDARDAADHQLDPLVHHVRPLHADRGGERHADLDRVLRPGVQEAERHRGGKVARRQARVVQVRGVALQHPLQVREHLQAEQEAVHERRLGTLVRGARVRRRRR